MDYALVADSSCELTAEIKETIPAAGVPLTMTAGGKEYVDDERLDVDAFLRDIENSRDTPRSSCPSPEDYANAFAASPAEKVFAVTLSSKLSGSYTSALIGSKLEQARGKTVHIFDSKSASAGETLTALKIAELAGLKADFQTIVEETQRFINNMKTFFVLENTDIMVKNGRMNPLLGKALGLLNIRLILGSDGEGSIKLFSKARGAAAALHRLAETVTENRAGSSGGRLVITHCMNPQGAAALAGEVREACRFDGVDLLQTGGLSSMYASRGGIIAAF